MNFIKNSLSSLFKKQPNKTQTVPSQKVQQQQIPPEVLLQLFTLSSQLIKTSKAQSDNAIKLKLYSLYKQATVGDCQGEKPQMFDFVGKSKWEAWQGLRGMSKQQAMRMYVQAANEADPSIGNKISQKFQSGSGSQEQVQNKASQSGVGYKKVQAQDYSDSYSHPYFKAIEKGQQIEALSHEQLLIRNNQPAIYPLHFAIDRERADLVSKFLAMLSLEQIKQMKDAEGTGILEYAQLIQNQQILQLVRQKVKE